MTDKELEQAIIAAEQATTPPDTRSTVRRGFDAGAKLATKAVGTMLVPQGLYPPGQESQREQDIQATGTAVVPQTPLQAGAMAGTLGAGPLVGLAARVGLPVGVLQAYPALARILGAAGGGAGGEMADQGPSLEAAGTGAAIGGGSAGLAEGAMGAVGKLLRSIPGAKRRIAGADAERFATAAGELAPPLRGIPSDVRPGATTTERLRSMATGPGQSALGESKEHAITAIEKLLGEKNAFPMKALGGAAEVTKTIPSIGATYTAQEPRQFTLREANEALSEIGAKAFGKNPLDRTVNGVDQRQLYGQIADQIRAALAERSAPSAALWDAAQGTYKRGLGVTRLLENPAAFRNYSNEVQLNTPALQKFIARPRAEAALAPKLGGTPPPAAAFETGEAGSQEIVDDVIGELLGSGGGLKRLQGALLRGGRPGMADELAPGPGRVSDALRMFMEGRGGSASVLAALPRTVLPNFSSRYAGRAPYAPPENIRTILDLLATRGGAEMAGR